MWGGVGRGKSFLMDCFFQAVPLTRKTRLHFHEFMREVHRELQELKGTADPLEELGERIARRFRLICFDEFHVADVTDAMILHRLLEALFASTASASSPPATSIPTACTPTACTATASCRPSRC
jgi:cell division protein ZapE